MKTKGLFMLLAGSVLLASCGGAGRSSSADSAKSDTAETVTKLVKTADMRLRVNNVQQTGEQVSKLTLLCGGMVMHHNMQSNVVSGQDINLGNDSIKRVTIYNTEADMVLKIPAESMELFMDSLNHLGTFVDERHMNIEDRTADYVGNRLKAENREASAQLRTQIKKLDNRVADSILVLKDQAVDRKVANMKTLDSARFSTLTLNLYQNKTVKKEVIPSEDLSDYNTSFGVRMGLALSRGWYYFSELIVVLSHLWAFILTGVVAGVAIWYFQKKRKAVQQISTDIKK